MVHPWLCSLVLGRTLFRVLWREILSRVSWMKLLVWWNSSCLDFVEDIGILSCGIVDIGIEVRHWSSLVGLVVVT